MGTYKEKILVVGHDFQTRQILKSQLSICSYQVSFAVDGEEAIARFRNEQPDLIILDTVLPKIDGYKVCQEIRCESQVPIIFLSALASISDRVMGLDLGADDYLIKPFSLSELKARIRSVLRRMRLFQPNNTKLDQDILYIKSLKIDMYKRQIFKGLERIKLTVMEFNIFELLVQHAGTPLSRSLILDNVWGYTPQRYLDTRVVDVHISRLRSKLEEDPRNPMLIITTRGKGYMFQEVNSLTV